MCVSEMKCCGERERKVMQKEVLWSRTIKVLGNVWGVIEFLN